MLQTSVNRSHFRRSICRRSICRLGAAAALILLATGCGDYGDGGNHNAGSAPPAASLQFVDRPLELVPGALVGRIDDVDAFIAIVRDGDVVRAYVSNGTPERLTIDRRFEATWTGTGAITMTSGSFQLTLEPNGTGVAGRLAAGGGRVTFRAEPAPQPFGLYVTHGGSAVEALARYSIELQGGSRGTVRPRGVSCRYEVRSQTQSWLLICG